MSGVQIIETITSEKVIEAPGIVAAKICRNLVASKQIRSLYVPSEIPMLYLDAL
jgi:hypothetical protein